MKMHLAGSLSRSRLPRTWATLPKIELGSCRTALTKFVKAVRFEIPLGYQNETGFHYGEEPERTRICYCGDV
jgi:hypothetical protein